MDGVAGKVVVGVEDGGKLVEVVGSDELVVDTSEVDGDVVDGDVVGGVDEDVTVDVDGDDEVLVVVDVVASCVVVGFEVVVGGVVDGADEVDVGVDVVVSCVVVTTVQSPWPVFVAVNPFDQTPNTVRLLPE